MEDAIPARIDRIPDSAETPEPAYPRLAAGLITLLQEMFDAQQTLVLTLSDAERLAPGTLEKWSAKDTLSHIVAWNDILNLRLDRASRGEAQPEYGDVNKVNQEFYQTRHKLSWSAVLEASRKAYNRLVERIREMQEAELTEPDHFDWLEGEPLWRRIVRTAYVHPLIHLAYYYNLRGRKALGLQIQEEAAQKLLALDDSPDWRSGIIYNLACQYSLSGDKATAIMRLRQALQTDRRLLAWSQQDPDFNSIRDDPEFQAIYAELDSP